MTIEQIDGQLAAAQAELIAACAAIVETYRTSVIPGLIAAIRANLFRPLLCPGCKKLYAVGIAETRALMCCEREAVSVLVSVPPGRGLFLPRDDQYVEAPAIVEGTRL